ncbi:Cu(2+)-transporting P-type ATPase CCC2 [Nakaseomyces bracarensis]|uniref:Cu(2+)-transporting P-type ATPase CCC2 n=1 Tax=Nakaseomyces bracarensis TaxID=273131 RepID=UPI0038712C54
MREALLTVEGMTCSSCVNSVTEQVRQLSVECSVSLVTSECKVVYEDEVKVESIKEAIEDCGFDCIVISDRGIGHTETRYRGLIGIKGMTCSSCVSTVTKQLEKVDGVHDVNVSLLTEECTVEYDPSVVTIDQIKETIDDCGFDASIFSNEPLAVENDAKMTTLRILGYEGNSSEVDGILANFQTTEGVKGCNFDSVENTVSVEYVPCEIGIRKIINDLEAMGLHVMVEVSYDKNTQLNLLNKATEISYWRSSCMKSCLIAFFTMLLYMGIPMLFPAIIKDKKFPYHKVGNIEGLFYRDIFGFIFATYVQFAIGGTFYKSALASLKHGAGTMDTLVSFSTTCAYLFSLYSITVSIIHPPTNGALPKVIFDTSVMIIAYISIGKYLENKAKSKTSTALSKLVALTPSSCTVVTNPDDYSETQDIGIELLEVGDIVMIKPGSKIPSDGFVLRGNSEVDESLMTGESILVPKTTGSSVIGGTINGSGLLYFKVSSVGEDTKLANIIRVMKEAQLKKASIQRYTDYVASIFVPTVLLLALVTFIVWSCLTRSNFVMSKFTIFGETRESRFYMCLQIATSVIIVACPCALGLATPTAIMVGTGVASENGVLIKGGDILEKFNEVDTFVFDKTGTLTTGHMKVQEFVGDTKVTRDLLLLQCIEKAESLSDHPVAKAIVNYCKAELNTNMTGSGINIQNEELITGKGIVCSCETPEKNFKLVIGNKSLMDQASLEKFWGIYGRAGPCTVTYVSVDDTVCGRFEIHDEVKSDAKPVIEYLRSKNYEIFMVTGDTHKSAMKVAEMFNIDVKNVYSEVSPSGKCDAVNFLKNEKQRTIAFVGDGINDSPALVTSDLGIAISSGTEIAIEAAGIVILSDSNTMEPSLKGIVNALDISLKTFKKVKLNLFWALCYNIFMLPIAMGILVPWGITLHPMIAGLAMAFSSVSVVLNSLLLKRWKSPEIDHEVSNYYHTSKKNYKSYAKDATEQLARLLGSGSTGKDELPPDLELQPTSASTCSTSDE